jgi:SHS2 domain-containing protein
MYELFDHTADLGLRVKAKTLDALFAEAGECLFAAVVEDVRTIQPEMTVELTVAGKDREYLMFDWLRELLLRSHSENLLFGCFVVTVTDAGLTATVSGEPIDPDRHPLAREVKAITYHGLKVEQTKTGWLAEVIVDI